MTSQEQNQLLLNAIKNKFSAKNAEGVSNCNTHFLIPTLKTTANTDGGATLKNLTIPSLNCVQAERLERASAANCISNKFTLPALKTSADKNQVGIQKLTKRLEELRVNKEQLSFYGTRDQFGATSTKIDLTTALSAPNETQHKRKAETMNVENFDIPFIECDKRTKKKKEAKDSKPQLAKTKTKTVLLGEPSAFGRLMSLKYTDTYGLHATINHDFKVKFNIEPFKFDTKSPDDLVLSMLNKVPRRT